jgi:hypothetical protein
MTMQTNNTLQDYKTTVVYTNSPSSEFLHLASQFLANTPINTTRETYGKLPRRTRPRQGRFASMVVSDLRAKVIKVERR